MEYIEDITDADYKRCKKVWKDLKIKNLGEYHRLYAQSDILLLVDAFENFRNKFIKTLCVDPDHFLWAPGLTWQACFKNAEVRVINWYWYVINGRKEN